MNHVPDVVWVSASSGAKAFDRPLLQYLSKQMTVAQWQYEQSLDEASSLDAAVELLLSNRPSKRIAFGTAKLTALHHRASDNKSMLPLAVSQNSAKRQD